MSVIIKQSISLPSGDIENKLRDAGLIKEMHLYSPKRKASVYFKDTLDYEACHPGEALKIKEEYRAEGYKKLVEGKYERADYTEEELKELLYMPVYFENNAMCWNLNYDYDSSPSYLISKAFPNDIFKYSCFTEGHFDGWNYIKNGEMCTENGIKIEQKIWNVNGKLFKEVPGYRDADEPVWRVNLPLDKNDKYFATIYVPKDQIQNYVPYPQNLTAPNKNICITHIGKEVFVYRTLHNGAKVRESWTWDKISRAYSENMENFKKAKKAERLGEFTQMMHEQAGIHLVSTDQNQELNTDEMER